MRIEHSVVIDRPVEEVFAFLNDAEKLPQWNTAITDARQTSQGPIGVGTTFHLSAQFLGRRMDSQSEVTAYEPNQQISYKTKSGPVPMDATYKLEPAGGATRVLEVIEAEPGSFFRLAEPVLKRMAQRQMETSLSNLKDLLEAERAT